MKDKTKTRQAEMTESVKDLYGYKILNRTIAGKGDNLYKLAEYFAVNEQDEATYEKESDLQVGHISYNLYHHIVNILSSRYRIEGMPNHLKLKNFWRYFVSGKMIFFKGKMSEDGEELLLFSQYTASDWDLFFDPIKVTPIFPNPTAGEADKKLEDQLGPDDFVEVLFNPQRQPLILLIGRLLSDLQWFYDEMKYDGKITRAFMFIGGMSSDDTIESELNKKVGERNFFKMLATAGVGDNKANELVNKLTSDLNEKMEVLQGKPRLNDVIIPSQDIITNYIFEILSLNRNDNKNKKERMITDEVNINNETKRYGASTVLDLMTEGFDTVNKMFGTSIKVIDTEEEMQDEQQDQTQNDNVDQKEGDK